MRPHGPRGARDPSPAGYLGQEELAGPRLRDAVCCLGGRVEARAPYGRNKHFDVAPISLGGESDQLPTLPRVLLRNVMDPAITLCRPIRPRHSRPKAPDRSTRLVLSLITRPDVRSCLVKTNLWCHGRKFFDKYGNSGSGLKENACVLSVGIRHLRCC